MVTNPLTPFADWLSISYSSSQTPHLSLDSFFSKLGVIECVETPEKALYRFLDGGTCLCMLKREFHNFSFSGSTLDVIRKLGLFNEFLTILMDYPSNITRLDIAYDIPLAFTTYYKKLKATYPSGKVEILGHWRKSQVILANCPRTNELTGTYYFQDRTYKGSVKLRVYDKSYETFCRTSTAIPPLTRIELTLSRSVGLKDFVNPLSCFWHHIPSELLKAPENVPEFVKTARIVLADPIESSLTAWQQFDIIFERSAYLQSLKAQMVGKPLADRRALKMSLLKTLSLYDL